MPALEVRTMGKMQFYETLKKEIARIDSASTAKREEIIIEGFAHEDGSSERALIKGKKFLIFNSNDYLGLRHNSQTRKAEHDAVIKYGSGPGAVRFISGTLGIYRELEQELAKFHNAESAITFSSSFAANLAVIHCMIKGQSKDTAVGGNTLVISDELNHRSIIDGIRVANLPKDNRLIFRHLDYNDLAAQIQANLGKFTRVLIISDGVFSMLGEYADLAKIQSVADKYDSHFDEGIITIIDDAHGIGGLGKNGRGTEEQCKAMPDLLVATMGKGLGADGGYVAGRKILIDYLRESAATYIYSNPVSPGTAGAALRAVQLLQEDEGKVLLSRLHENIGYFKKLAKSMGFRFACDSIHAIQPLLIGDPAKTRQLTKELYGNGILVTQISYPVVPQGRDEIRVQISASHSKKDIDDFMAVLEKSARKIGVIQ